MVSSLTWLTSYVWISVYYASDARSVALEQSLRKLGVEKLTKDDVQKMQWEVLEAKIGNWIHYMRIAVSITSVFFWVAISVLI